jgi:4-amino-4-deoxy-L-arabinose transferase-like glycosyltransferase
VDRGRERELVLGAMAAAVAAVLLYVINTRGHALRGDEVFYDETARFWVDGKLWWGTLPFGEAHPTAWKPPLYPAFVGMLYTVFGEEPVRAEYAQSLLAALTVLLTWALARRLFGVRAAVVAAWAVALFPLAFEYYGLLFPEALAIPLTVLALYLFIERPPTVPRAALVGAVIGVGLLVRPTSVFLFAGVLAAFIVGVGWRRGAVLTALAVVAAALVVAPWTIRNYYEQDGFIPISVQDGAVYGTFNEEAAREDFTWRAFLRNPPAVLEERDPDTSEAELRAEMQEFAYEYIEDNPDSLPKAFFWNGIVRFWDFRSPQDAVDEVAFQGRSRTVRWIGLGMYYLLLPLAAFGLWRLRRWPAVFAPVLAIVIAASLTFTVIGGTRYRAPLEPLLVVLAASLAAKSVRTPSRRPLP